MVSSYLGEAGFSVTHAPTGHAGIALAGRDGFDALVLDLMLPDIDGLEVCRRIRTRAGTAILRRRGGDDEAREVLRFGRLQIDPGALEVKLDGEARALTSHQFALLL